MLSKGLFTTSVIPRRLWQPNLEIHPLSCSFARRMSSSLPISYATAHAPARVGPMSLSSKNSPSVDVHQIAFQYRAADQEKPEFLSIAETIDMGHEAETSTDQQHSSDSSLENKVFDFVSVQQVPNYQDIANQKPTPDHVIVAVFITLQDESTQKRAAHDEWYETEHVPMLSKVPGWLRTRRYVTGAQEKKVGPTEYLALHEYLPENGLDGPEFKAATSTPWNAVIKRDCVKEKRRRVWRLQQSEPNNA